MLKKNFFLQVSIFYLVINSCCIFSSQNFEDVSILGSNSKRFVPSLTEEDDFEIIKSVVQGKSDGFIASRVSCTEQKLCFAKECDNCIKGATLSSQRGDQHTLASIFIEGYGSDSLSSLKAFLAVMKDDGLLSQDHQRLCCLIVHAISPGNIIAKEGKVYIEDLAYKNSRKRGRE